MSRKKIIILISVISIVILGGSVFGFYFLKNRTQNKKTCDVFPMMEVAMQGGYFGNSEYMSGNVVADKEQNVYLTNDDKILEVCVQEGDIVHTGDVLLKFDTTAQSLQLDIKRAQVEIARTNVLAAERQLTKLQNTTPVEPTTEEPTTEEPTTEEPTTEETPDPGEATPGDAAEEGTTTEGTTTEAPTTEGTTTGAPVAPEAFVEQEEYSEEITYTKEELDAAIDAKQREIKQLKIDYQLLQIELEIQEAKCQNGEVICSFDGVVKTVSSQDTAIMDHVPFITVSGSDGYTVKSTIGELSLDKYHIGDTISMFCYDTGMNYEGTISEISTTPTADYYGYSAKEQSYYPMTIIVENADDLKQGMYVEISSNDLDNMDSADSLYLVMAFVKKDNGKYYVMKEVDGKLKKVYIETGDIVWGDTIEIKSGVTMDDYLALPTSKNAKEGVKTVRKTSNELYGY